MRAWVVERTGPIDEGPLRRLTHQIDPTALWASKELRLSHPGSTAPGRLRARPARQIIEETRCTTTR